MVDGEGGQAGETIQNINAPCDSRCIIGEMRERAISVDSAFPCTIKRSISRRVSLDATARILYPTSVSRKNSFDPRRDLVVRSFLRNPFSRCPWNRHPFLFVPLFFFLFLFFLFVLSVGPVACSYGKRRGKIKCCRYPCRYRSTRDSVSYRFVEGSQRSTTLWRTNRSRRRILGTRGWSSKKQPLDK